jgi:hypothetical protein
LTLTCTVVGNLVYLLESTNDRLSRVDSSQALTRVVVTYLDPLVYDFHIEESLFVSGLLLLLNVDFALRNPFHHTLLVLIFSHFTHLRTCMG